MNKAESFFSTEESEAIKNAIGAVEKKTSGEVAVMVVDASDSYPEGSVLAGVLVGGLLALLAVDLVFADSLWHFVPIWGALGLAIGWLCRYLPWLKRLFVAGSRLEEEVRLRALRAFYEKGLYKTRDATGVLFFLSLFEHKVWILADQGIYAKISPEELQSYAADIASGVRAGQGAAMLCKEIGRVGEVLALHFPVREDDVNELVDEIHTEGVGSAR